jgi:hypothetical protein
MDAAARDFEELEDPENWDFDNVQIQPPVKNPRAIVSVPLNRNELSQIEAAARRCGISLSEYIKGAALQRSASPEQNTTTESECGHPISLSDSKSAESFPKD